MNEEMEKTKMDELREMLKPGWKPTSCREKKWLENVIWQFVKDANDVKDLQIWKPGAEKAVKTFIREWVKIEMALNSNCDAPKSSQNDKDIAEHQPKKKKAPIEDK